jgi:hypothetical protein
MRATPKTSSPVQDVSGKRSSVFSRERRDSSGTGQTFSNLGPERDVLGGSALDLLLGRHGCLYYCCSSSFEVGQVFS